MRTGTRDVIAPEANLLSPRPNLVSLPMRIAAEVPRERTVRAGTQFVSSHCQTDPSRLESSEVASNPNNNHHVNKAE